VCGPSHPLRPQGLHHPGDGRAHLGLLDILIGGGEGLVGGREDDHAGPPLGTAGALGHKKYKYLKKTTEIRRGVWALHKSEGAGQPSWSSGASREGWPGSPGTPGLRAQSVGRRKMKRTVNGFPEKCRRAQVGEQAWETLHT